MFVTKRSIVWSTGLHKTQYLEYSMNRQRASIVLVQWTVENLKKVINLVRSFMGLGFCSSAYPVSRNKDKVLYKVISLHCASIMKFMVGWCNG